VPKLGRGHQFALDQCTASKWGFLSGGEDGDSGLLYFFNIYEGGIKIPDPEGTDLPSWEAAQEEARVVVEELRREFPARFGFTSVLEVVTACGRRVMALPIREPLCQ